MKLTAAKVRSLTKPGRYGDGGTLHLVVAPGGSKSWVQRIAIDGRRRDIGLGGWPVVGLAKARQRAFANRVAVSDGRNPLAEKRKARTLTFREAALKTYEANRPRWRGDRTATIWKQQMERHAFPILADLPVDEIGREDVLRCLTPIWTAHLDIARKLRGRIRAVLAWAQAHGHVEHNAAGDAISGALPAMPSVMKHHRALRYQDVPEALEAVRASGASLAAKAGFEFLVLTAARAGEVRLATWAEIDAEARTWRIPAARMKGGVEWRVPLAAAALAVLDRMRPLRGPADLLFASPTRPSRPLSNMTWNKLMRDLGIDAVPHGFRSSFRDWCAETGKPREVAEAALAHTVGGVEGAYFRSDVFERRRRLMQEWAGFVTGDRAKVVRISN
ncbi:MAG: tyrosine-type recombinase/integrase [Acidobacteria bacterium]|nr:tyrosine-type recombinase/integrase [Acidobacteriota bacterium]